MRADRKGWRPSMLRFFFVAFAAVIGFRLFYLQILSAGFYSALAEGEHSLYEELVPRRGVVLVKDYNDVTEYPVASVTQKGFVYADPRKVKDPVTLGKDLARILNIDGVDEYDQTVLVKQLTEAENTSQALELQKLVLTNRAITLPENEDEITKLYADTIANNPNKVESLIARLSKQDDPYEPITHDATEEQVDLIEALGNEAISYVLEEGRSYPEEPDFGGHVIGFLGVDDAGKPKGFYGIEGYFNDFLGGISGELYSQTDSKGTWIGVGQRKLVPAVDGGDVLLTIDRTIQVKTCDMLKATVAEYQADSGTLVIIEPSTGRITAMCGTPDFDPSEYNNVPNGDYSVYNNPAIFDPYEPGSIMKPLVMAGAIDIGSVTPNTTFTDPGFVKVDDFTIHNSGNKSYGIASMIDVLDESINTGMIWVAERMGRDVLKDYLQRFGFGALTGVELKTETTGTIASLDRPGQVYPDTASFGQGVTVTPLQIAAAYAAIANGGAYMKPHVVDELRYSDGTVEKVEPEMVRQIVSPATATTTGAMLISVVENGHGKKAAVPGYYIAGKTGTAQVAENGVYSETNYTGSFAGFGPAKNPRFAMLVQIKNPKRGIIFAESTAAPLFGKIAKFLLQYYGVAPERTIK